MNSEGGLLIGVGGLIFFGAIFLSIVHQVYFFLSVFLFEGLPCIFEILFVISSFPPHLFLKDLKGTPSRNPLLP